MGRSHWSSPASTEKYHVLLSCRVCPSCGGGRCGPTGGRPWCSASSPSTSSSLPSSTPQHQQRFLSFNCLFIVSLFYNPYYTVATGSSSNIVFFLKILEYSGLWSFSVFPRCQFVYTHTRHVEHQRCSRTGKVQKNQKF